MGAIRVAIVGDDRLFRDGLHQILRGDPSFLIADDNHSASSDDVDVRLIDARFGHLIAENTIPTGGLFLCIPLRSRRLLKPQWRQSRFPNCRRVP